MVEAIEGRVENSVIEEGTLDQILKKYALKALDYWNPLKSDFTIIKTRIEVTYKLPPPDHIIELLDHAEEQQITTSKEDNTLVLSIPVYTISYDNEWYGDAYRDRRIIVIAPYIDLDEKAKIEEYASEATGEARRLEEPIHVEPEPLQLTEDEMRRLEEGLKELEEEPVKEKPRKRGRRRKKKASSR